MTVGKVSKCDNIMNEKTTTMKFLFWKIQEFHRGVVV